MQIKEAYFDPTCPPSDNCLYIDIETTGLSRDRTILYMIGCGFFEDRKLHVIQWFNNDGSGEPEILQAFADFFYTFSKEKEPVLVSFNGDHFDLPYLIRHYDMNEIPYPMSSAPSLDLYRILRPYKELYHMEKCRQKDWELLMGFDREDTMSGGELIGVYRDYLRTRDEAMADLLYLHNYEDVCYLCRLSPLLALDDLSCGRFSYQDLTLNEEDLCLDFYCKLAAPLPLRLETSCPLGSVSVDRQEMTLSLPLTAGVMKHFYPHHKDYYYLPEEDRAVHKSIGQYVDRGHREKCSPSNCYIKKEGIFLPVYDKKKLSSSINDCPALYRPEYPDKTAYIELEDLYSSEMETLIPYLKTTLSLLLFQKKRK